MTYEHRYGETDKCRYDIVSLSGVGMAVVVQPHSSADAVMECDNHMENGNIAYSIEAITALFLNLTEDQQQIIIDKMKSLAAGGCYDGTVADIPQENVARWDNETIVEVCE